MSGLRVRLAPPVPKATVQNYQVHVVLRDTSMEDVEHPEVAAATAQLRDDIDEFYLPVDLSKIDSRNRYSLWVHATPQSGERILPGDFITTTSIPVSRLDIEEGREIQVSLVEV